jgi:hypothetical protein
MCHSSDQIRINVRGGIIMTKNIRRFAAAVSLSLFVSVTPLLAAPTRDEGRVTRERERSSIVQVLQKLAKRFFKLVPTDGISLPVPGPSTEGNNP